MRHHITRYTRRLIFWALIAGAILLTGARYFLSGIEVYKADLQASLSEVLEAPVEIGKMRVNIYGYTPKLVLSDINVLQIDSSTPVIQLREIRLGVDLFSFLINWDLLSAARITLVGAKLSVKRKADGSISVVGLKASDEQPVWLLEGGHFEMLKSEVVWQDEKRSAARHEFNDVDISINNELADGEHQVNIALNLPDKLGHSLQLAMRFTGDIFESGNLDGQLYAEGKNIQLDEMVTGDLPMGLAVDDGVADFKLWSRWKDTRMVSIAGKVQTEQSNIILQNKKTLPVEKAGGGFRWQLHNDYWQLDVKDFFLETDGKNWSEASLSVWVSGTETDPLQKVSLSISELDIEELVRLVLFSGWLGNEQADLLKKMEPKGQVNNLFLFAEMENKKFSVNGNFKQISFSAVNEIPEIHNLSGYIKGTELSGFVWVDTENGQITFPGLFRKAIDIDRLSGKLAWSQGEENWILSSSMMELDSPDIETRNKFQIVFSKHEEQAFMDLQTFFFNGKDAAKAKNYLPSGIMDADVVEWLDKAFLAGKIGKGKGLFFGPLADYPFTEGQGVFEVLYDIKDGDLNYAEGWPHITDIDAVVLFFQSSLQVTFNHAHVSGAAIKQADGAIPSLVQSDHLLLKGQIVGSVEQAMEFLQQSPLEEEVNPVLDVIDPKGSTVVELEMKIPLSDEAKAEVDGKARFNNAQLTILPLNVPVQKISGDLQFSEEGISSESLEAMALGFPIQAQIRNDSYQTSIDVAGSMDIAKLEEQFETEKWAFADGQADYRLLLTVPHDEEIPAELVLKTDLKGISVELPEPLGKSVEQIAPFSLAARFTDDTLLPVELFYTEELSASLLINKEEKQIFSGNILFGRGKAEFLRNPRIKLAVTRNEFLLDPWLNQEANQEENTRVSIDEINELDIHIGNFYWNKHEYGYLDLQLAQIDQQWQGHISNLYAQGKLNLPLRYIPDSRISMDMKYIDLTNLGSIKMGGESLSPVDFPLLSIRSDQILWQDVNLGKLTLETRRVVDGVVFDQLEVAANGSRLSLPGSSWKINNGMASTDATGTLVMDDMGEFLSRLDITDDMKETRAEIDLSLYWTGAPYQFSLVNVEGLVEINLEDGRLLGIEPGIGRILGVLDVGQLGRRLQLDFSDVYSEGLTYDDIKGSFKIADGYAETDNLVIDAVPATIKITGKTGLITQDYDQIVTVIPKSSAAIPIAGTIVKGIAGLVAKSLTGERREGFFISSQYAMKGNWGEAEIIPLHENDGLLQKAWTGITDFSWLGIKKEIEEKEHE